MSAIQSSKRPAVSERAFGATIGGILGALGGVRIGVASFGGGSFGVDVLSACLLTGGAALLLLALLRPSLLATPNRLWFKFGLLLSKVVNPVAMLLLYLVCVAPIGLAMRLFGYDPLLLKRDPRAASYWIEYEPSPLEEPMRHQF